MEGGGEITNTNTLSISPTQIYLFEILASMNFRQS